MEEVVRGLCPDEVPGVRALFEGLEVLSIGLDEAWRAGTWRREFATKGVTLTQADWLVAAAAYVSGAKIVTGNPKD